MSKVTPGKCDEYINDLSKEIDKLQLNELNCSKPEEIINTVITKYLSTRWFKRTAWLAIPNKEKHLKKIKILFWKLKGDHSFLAACREENIDDIKDKFKDTLKEATGYLSYCVHKNYTYKHSNSNIRRFNDGLDPILIPIEQPLSNRTARLLSKNTVNSVGNTASVQENSSNQASRETNAMTKIKSFLLKKTKTIKNKKKKAIVKSFLLGSLRKRRTKRQNNNEHEMSINFKRLYANNNNNNNHEKSTNFKRLPETNNNDHEMSINFKRISGRNNNNNGYVSAQSNNNNGYVTAQSNSNNNGYVTAQSDYED